MSSQAEVSRSVRRRLNSAVHSKLRKDWDRYAVLSQTLFIPTTRELCAPNKGKRISTIASFADGSRKRAARGDRWLTPWIVYRSYFFCSEYRSIQNGKPLPGEIHWIQAYNHCRGESRCWSRLGPVSPWVLLILTLVYKTWTSYISTGWGSTRRNTDQRAGLQRIHAKSMVLRFKTGYCEVLRILDDGSPFPPGIRWKVRSGIIRLIRLVGNEFSFPSPPFPFLPFPSFLRGLT